MSTIPKEIIAKIESYASFNTDTFIDEEKFIDGAKYGYQLATDGREELEKENARLKKENDWMKSMLGKTI